MTHPYGFPRRRADRRHKDRLDLHETALTAAEALSINCCDIVFLTCPLR